MLFTHISMIQKTVCTVDADKSEQRQLSNKQQATSFQLHCRLGYCCINTELRKKGVFTSRGMRKKTFREKGLSYVSELALQNIKDVEAHLKWNQQNDIRLFRFSSGFFPWMSEYKINELPNYDQMLFEAQRIGQKYFFLTDCPQRPTMHPDHFNVLASKNPRVVEKTIKELNQHAETLDMFGLPAGYSNPINIHVNTTQGGKKESLQRFRENFKYLSDSCQKRLVVENDDKPKQYTVEDLYEELYTKIDIPITFDYHHHRLNPGKLNEEKAIKLASKTIPSWKRQLVHYSSSRMLNEDKTSRSQAHADYIHERINTYDLYLDIELEAKAKEQSLLKYRKDYLQNETLYV